MIPVPRLHLISDRTLCPLDRFPEVARAAVAGGFDAVHLREKDLPGGELLQVARAVRTEIGDEALLIVNERLDVAILAAADGLQLGESGLPTAAARSLAPHLLIGRSVHDADGAGRAVEAGADYLLAGHVFETKSKVGQVGRGLAFLRSVTQTASVPVIAIGGITPERVPKVIAAGAWGVAVLSGILAASYPDVAARRYRDALGE